MMIVPAGVKVHLALGYTDMRKGLDGHAMLVQQTRRAADGLPTNGRLSWMRATSASRSSSASTSWSGSNSQSESFDDLKSTWAR